MTTAIELHNKVYSTEGLVPEFFSSHWNAAFYLHINFCSHCAIYSL